MRKRWLLLLVLLSAASPLLGTVNAVAADKPCADTIRDVQDDGTNVSYLPVRPLSENADEIGQFTLDGRGTGLTIQSMALDPVSCHWLAAVHLKRSPDRIGLWEISDVPSDGSLRHVTSQEFAHPQNLAVQISAHGVVWFWLPDEEGLGAKRFRLVEGLAGLKVVDVEHFALLETPLPSNTTAVSADGRNLLILDLMDLNGKEVEAVRIYRIDDIVGAPAADLIDIPPLYVWPLAPVQQPKGQYRQGLAMIGGTVFVLSGPPKIGVAKWLLSYSIDGKLLASDPLDVGMREALSDGQSKSYEPEGLTIMRSKAGVALAIGIASGDIGNRHFRLWSVPLQGQPVLQ
jgi:hypothetical protein